MFAIFDKNSIICVIDDHSEFLNNKQHAYILYCNTKHMLKSLALLQITVVIVAVFAVIIYIRIEAAKITRTATKGASTFKGIQEYYKINVRGNDTLGNNVNITWYLPYLEGKGPCDYSPNDYNPFSNPCTPPLHYHLETMEQFELIKGVVSFYVNGEIITLQTPGDSVIVDLGVIHTFWTNSTQDLILKIDRYPAGQMEEAFFENLAGMERDSMDEVTGELKISSLLNKVQNGIMRAAGDNFPRYLPLFAVPAYKQMMKTLSIATGVPCLYKAYTTNYERIKHVC